MEQGILGVLGRWTHSHRRVVFGAWGVLILSLGIFAPRLEGALSGAMWEVRGSDSLQVRQIIDQEFGGLSSQSAVVVLHSDELTAEDPEFAARIDQVTGILAAESAFGPAMPPQPSQDRHTAIVQAGALVSPTEAVRAAERLHDDLEGVGDDSVSVAVTGSPAFWADFNEMNSEGMRQAEIITWPITAVILVLAFGTLAAAGLPLVLTAAGLISAMGVLFGITRFTDLSIWTFNFAMMFALALGIDYALFIVTRFRNALHHSADVADAIGETMGSAGKAILFSGLTVIISLSAVLLVPIPAFQSMAAGMMLAVGFVLLAALTLLPAMLGPWVNRLPLPWYRAGEHRSERWAQFAAGVQRRAPVAAVAVIAILLAMAAPLLSLETGMPGISVLSGDRSAREGYEDIASAYGEGAPGPIQVIVPPGRDAEAIAATIFEDPRIVAVYPPQPAQSGGDVTLLTAISSVDPSTPEAGDVISGLRDELPAGVLVGGPVAENHDLDQALRQRAPLVIGVVLVLGFFLLLFALQALLIAAIGVVLNLLSVGAAFGVGALLFQHGIGSEVLGFESQGYLTSWAPLFFFALIFAISMDYTVFLLASTREHYERTGDPGEAVRASIAHTAAPIIAAAGVMVAVFLTFGLAGTLPMKEMGLILAVAVLVDAVLVRLILVPAILQLAGKAAWWLPGWIDRLLPDIRYAH
jgi:RND superfamily putative drug exporter